MKTQREARRTKCLLRGRARPQIHILFQPARRLPVVVFFFFRWQLQAFHFNSFKFDLEIVRMLLHIIALLTLLPLLLYPFPAAIPQLGICRCTKNISVGGFDMLFPRNFSRFFLLLSFSFSFLVPLPISLFTCAVFFSSSSTCVAFGFHVNVSVHIFVDFLGWFYSFLICWQPCALVGWVCECDPLLRC